MKQSKHYLTSIISNHPRLTAEDVKEYCRSRLIPFRVDASDTVCIEFSGGWHPVQWRWCSGQFFGNKFDLFIVA